MVINFRRSSIALDDKLCRRVKARIKTMHCNRVTSEPGYNGESLVDVLGGSELSNECSFSVGISSLRRLSFSSSMCLSGGVSCVLRLVRHLLVFGTSVRYSGSKNLNKNVLSLSILQFVS